MVPISIDCYDCFTEANYAWSGQLLDPAITRAQSTLTFVDAKVRE